MTQDKNELADAKRDAWSPVKKALWDVVTGEQLNDGHYINAYDLTEKLYATLPGTVQPVAVAVNIKPLEWAPFHGSFVSTVHGEHHFRWAYAVLEWWPHGDRFEVRLNGVAIARTPDAESGKAVAQADYETRIRSTLIPATMAGDGDVAGWRTMDSAPKDGEPLDLWCFWPESGEHYRTADARWIDGDWHLGQFSRHQYVHKPVPLLWMRIVPPAMGASEDEH